MPHFSKRSKDNLATCHPDLQKVAEEAIKHFDFTVYQGHRGKEAQDEYFRTGASKVKWPHSKHNKKPSLAFDAMPHPVDWKNWDEFAAMAKAMKAAAHRVGVKIVWGGDWKMRDGPHFELG